MQNNKDAEPTRMQNQHMTAVPLKLLGNLKTPAPRETRMDMQQHQNKRAYFCSQFTTGGRIELPAGPTLPALLLRYIWLTADAKSVQIHHSTSHPGPF